LGNKKIKQYFTVILFFIYSALRDIYP